ncbi:hypothetical protein SAMN05444266_101258 [Chitinophaga jiangningensis]|uniref:Uncharacterized protein n=1 Tax=Chitinophaga jiangningensis TaxID=1419482 RepID=A0A1M6VL09_9BACT|nr:hypothetical protein [Chitinophaga jiangningensis]SHK82237.1 hypothetical protein SAMN05444266_101258 [Chitinophaga jiangningensis]
MTKTLQIAARGILFGGLALLASQANAQLKIGANPTKIKKSAILELESDRQGLLLPRLADTTQINQLFGGDDTAGDLEGMMIYLTKSGAEGLYVRQHGGWHKLARGGQSWDILGNALNSAQSPFIGSTNNVPFVLRANNKTGIVIDDGKVTVSNGITITGLLEDLTANRGVFVNPTTGVASYRDFGTGAFVKQFSINGDNTPDFKLETADNKSYYFTGGPAGTLTLTVRNQDGTDNTAAGLLTYADWQRIQNAAAAKDLLTGNFNNVANNQGLSIDSATAGKKYVILHAADANNPGGVSTVAQEFNGPKTFLDELIAKTLFTAKSTANFEADVNVAGATALTGNLSVGATGTATFNGAATFANDVTMSGVNTNTNTTATDFEILLLGANSIVEKKTLPASAFTPFTFATAHTGTDLNVTTGTDQKVTIAVPYASQDVVAGLVNNQTQSFVGNKAFSDNIRVAKRVLIGDTLQVNPSSTLQVNGSFALPITTVTGTYTATVNDYTIIVKPGSDANVILPAASQVKGRIYVVKRAGVSSDGTVNQLAVAVKTSGTDKIEDGGTQVDFNVPWTTMTFQSDGVDTWYIIKN